MGLDINIVRLLLAARDRQVSFDRVLTVGRLRLYVYPRTMSRLLDKHNLPSAEFAEAGPACAFAEPFFRSLGASEIMALDYSDYEGADLVHDLNAPIPSAWKDRFDVVCDGGTLEHVFHFPTALQKCMEMVRPGGRLFIHTGINNFCGHGFYQFSPELFYRALSPRNGYEVERMIAHAIGPYNRWYEVSDPEQVGARVELITCAPMNMLIQARRIAAAPIFSEPPLQSDYTVMWRSAGGSAAGDAPASGAFTKVFPGLARLVHAAGTGIRFVWRQSLRNRRSFRPITKP